MVPFVVYSRLNGCLYRWSALGSFFLKVKVVGLLTLSAKPSLSIFLIFYQTNSPAPAVPTPQQFGVSNWRNEMNRRICCLLMATMHIIAWHSATCRPLVSHDSVHPPQDEIHGSALELKSEKGAGRAYRHGEGETHRWLSRLGSKPPSCQHKCEGCSPCKAVQIPATTDRTRLQYSNYEPEGWKCKCGGVFFNP